MPHMQFDQPKLIYLLTADIDHGEEAKAVLTDHLGEEAIEFLTQFDLQVLFPKELPPPHDAEALVVALDYLWLDARGRREFLERLSLLAPGLPKAAYGYDIDSEQPSTQSGVAVARKLNGKLLALLLGGGGNRRAA